MFLKHKHLNIRKNKIIYGGQLSSKNRKKHAQKKKSKKTKPKPRKKPLKKPLKPKKKMKKGKKTKYASKKVRKGSVRKVKARKDKKTRKVIRKVKSASVRLRKKKSKPMLKKSKKTISTKKAIKVKAKPKKEKKKEEVIVLSKEDMVKLAEILSRPFIRQMLVNLGGENAIAIIRNFDRSSSDEDIAKKLKIKISDVRAALNKLHSEGLVMYNRYKDGETGWYSYSWYLNKDKMEKWAEEHTRRFEDESQNNNEEFYVCPFCGVSTIVNFHDAFEKQFKCDICEKNLEFLDEDKMQKLGIVQTRSFIRTIR